MLAYLCTKGEIYGGPDGGGVIGTNELQDALTWLIQELRLCTKDCSTTGFTSLYILYPDGGKSKPIHPSRIFIS